MGKEEMLEGNKHFGGVWRTQDIEKREKEGMFRSLLATIVEAREKISC